MIHEAGANARGEDRPRRFWQRRWVQVAFSAGVLFLALFVGALEYVAHHAEPILRKRIIETLSARFHAPVELGPITISVMQGLQVSGEKLRIPYRFADGTTVTYPLLQVDHFSFHTSLKGLLRQPTHISRVQVDGMEVHIPSPEQRRQLLDGPRTPPGADGSNAKPKITLLVEHLRCRNVHLFVESGKPDKDPLLFNISALDMQDVGRNQAMVYDAQLSNPKPYGLIHAKGHFGPWAGSTAAGSTPDPGQTPVDGDYTFEHADLNTIRGIGGILSSLGHFSGVLDRITIDGTADVPKFSLDISNRPVPLHTRFHAIVDGTNGDTYLQPVQARLLQSDFTTWGKVVKVKGRGHDIELNVDIPRGRMQDFLSMAVKTSPPLMNGGLAMKAKLHIPPGRERVPIKMEMTGTFRIQGVQFNNMHWQNRLDGLSARAQGRPQEVEEVSRDREAEVRSELDCKFTMGHGLLTASDVHYAIPGAVVLLNGVYSMDGKLFEFKGHVRTQATASQMVGGWKGLLLKPVDRFLQKNGAGLELPIQISGTQGDLQFGLAMHGADDTPQQLLADVQAKDRVKRRRVEAHRLAAAADEEDQRAAKAVSVAEAARAHEAAKRDRAEALRLLQAEDSK